MGLRTKLGVLIAGTAAVVSVVMGLLVHHRTVDAQYANARSQLGERLRTAVQDHAAGVDGDRTLIDPPDLPKPLAAAARDGRWGFYLERGAGTVPVLWAASAYRGDVVALRRPYQRESATVRDVDRVLWMAGGVGTALASAAGLLVATRFGRRLTANAGTAQRIAEGDLTARLPEGGKDEIGKLAAAVNTMADALAGRLQAEREVTSNIAHELRTPVAGMVTAAGLLPPGRPSELVQDSARRLGELVDDVIEVARLDAVSEEPELVERDLGELVRRTVAGVDPGVRVEVLRDAVVVTDPRRVERVLANLVSNALRHGAAPVTVQVDGGVVRVRDQGDGFPERLLSGGPQRFRTGQRDTGLGLGLTIVAGQVRVLGARVRFENPVGGGALAVLDLRGALAA
ncbi:HAMP domain-containing histidine kinase [Streptomyces sp. SID14478]|uniref:HAMP domain-containing sensor histidine kinase n=1 Tax=Streptomyces sp. SID14478 TaxID=2706073 RepID=UPI0013DEE602|nr:HAMP domain-containing sensor histidine kinase [Streptomyces sp. SID14478]NEB81641.1 HAMP domain-containing histidine kinase [Streptomyces sp. SID14478]